MVGMPVLDFVKEENREFFKEKFRQRLTREVVSDYYELELNGKSGRKVPVMISARGLYDQDDTFQGVMATFVDISDRRRAELALQASERLCRNIMSSAPIGIAYAEQGRLKWTNESMMKMFGHDNEREYLNTSIKAFYASKDDYLRARDAFYRGLAEGKSAETEARFRRKDGSTFLGQIRISAMDPSDPKSGTITTLADVSRQRLAEEALRESEEKYRILVDRAQEGVFVAQDGLLRFVNPRMSEMLGHDPSGLISEPFTKFIHPEDRSSTLQYHFKRLQGEEFPSRYTLRILDKSGGIKWAEIDVALIRWEERPAVLGFLTDITERKAMEEAAKEREEWRRSLVENSFDGIFVQQDSKIIFANSRLHQMLGYLPGELEGMEHWRVYYGKYQRLTQERAEARMRGENAPPQYEVMLQRKDGSFFAGEVSAKLVTIKGRPGVQAWIKDISRRKRTEETQRRLATVVQQASEAVVIMDADNRIQYVNPAFEKITGYALDDVMGQTPQMWKDENDDPELYQQIWETVSGGEVWRGQLTNCRKDGTSYLEDVTVSPVRDASDQIINYVAIKRDISREVELQRQLVQAQKMESLGTLAGGIAHDFNNLLTVIGGYSELLLMDKQEDDPGLEDLHKIAIAARRGAELVKNLLAFGRKMEPQLRPVDLNREVEQIRKLLIRTIPKMIEVEVSLANDLARIKADPAQIGQLIMNLALNAQDAMPNGGKLTIETRNVSLDQTYCETHLLTEPGSYVLLTFSDTGHGMDKVTLERIFEPFYTTKEIGKGTGLGLAVAYGIVQQHEGLIQCHSEPGAGTIFEIYLPAIDDQRKSVKKKTARLMPTKGSETILWVDDEDFVRDFGVRILHRQGYTVMTAGDGQEGWEIYEKSRDKIGLVILDLIMPEMGGKQCLEKILETNPQAKILIASGAGGLGTTEEAIAAGAKGFIRKPFRIDEMLRAIRRVLDSD
jgi:two-component system cell cycle sensor histidine kinase/response regulator CckA